MPDSLLLLQRAVGGDLGASWGGLRELIKATGPCNVLLKAGYWGRGRVMEGSAGGKEALFDFLILREWMFCLHVHLHTRRHWVL